MAVPNAAAAAPTDACSAGADVSRVRFHLRSLDHRHSNSPPRPRLVLFAGAGVSQIAPTSLPSWSELGHEAGAALARTAAAIDAPLAEAALERLRCQQASGKWPPEFQAEILAERLGAAYFEALRELDSTTPNAVHRLAARWIRSGVVRAIITTNLDRAFEAALTEAGVAVPILVRPADMASWAAAGDTTVPALLKIHGSADDSTSLIDTLAQHRVGLAPGVMVALNALRQNAHWLFLGYSGADLEAAPTYLGLHHSLEQREPFSFTWLCREGVEPRAVVRELAEKAGERGQIVFGDLPQWLTTVDEDGATATPDATAASTQAAELHGATPAVQSPRAALAAGLGRWAESLGPITAGLALADLVRACGAADLARELIAALMRHAERCGTTRELASASGAHSMALAASGQSAAARDLAERELALWTELADDRGRARALNNLATIYEAQGEYPTALAAFQQSLALKVSLGDLRGQSITRMGVAALLRRRGRLAEARDEFLRLADLKATLGDEVGRGMALNGAAGVLQQLGDVESAEAAYREAVRIFERLGELLSLSIALTGLARLAQRRGELETAAIHYAHAERLKRHIGDRRGLAAVQLGQSAVARSANQGVEALRLAESALATYTELGDTHGRGLALNSVALAAQAVNDIERAERCFGLAIELKRQLGDSAGEAVSIAGLAALRQRAAVADRR